ncbi:Calcium-dependent protein kinase 29 (OsCDPK29) (OsCPK29) [Durusdinium trenchii]|uniref:Calcium-dependent protein kinase 29 (OsCDPK29) (OsCPK29) n=1 Tax=Durusdinium trenchii TaxID=1381693 RepID=A0ABP0S4A3_9DINO
MAPKAKDVARPKGRSSHTGRSPSPAPRRSPSPAPRGGAPGGARASRGGSKEPKSEPKAEPKKEVEKKDEKKDEEDEEIVDTEVVEKPPPVVTMEKEQIKKIFGRFDLNGNGTIEVEELAVVFQVLAPRQWSQKAIKRLFDGMDLDEDGKVCFSEFIEWIFDTGTNSFKGALEIAETMDGAKTLEWSVADCKEPLALPNLRIELGIVEGCSMEEEILKLEPTELQKLETLPVVPHPIRRVLEAVYMLLLPSSGLPSINALTPPEWAGIQEMLHESTTLPRIMDYKARKEETCERARVFRDRGAVQTARPSCAFHMLKEELPHSFNDRMVPR